MKKLYFINFLILIISTCFAQVQKTSNTKLIGIPEKNSNLQNQNKACPAINFNRYNSGTGVYSSFTGGSPYNCSGTYILLADYTGINPKYFEFIDPSWQVRFYLDSKGGTDNSLNVRENGFVFATNYTQGRANNNVWIVSGNHCSPTSRYEFQLCDVSGDGTIPYAIFNIFGERLDSGQITFTTPNQCSTWKVINSTDLPGTAYYSGPGITSYDDGSADWSPAAAGPGVHTIQYCWNDGRTCSSCTTKTVTVVGPTVNAGTDKYICTNGSVTIGGSPTASGGVTPYIYSWSPSSGLSSTTVANPSASPTNSTDYIVVVKDNNGNGCSATDTVRVRVNKITISSETSTNIACYGQNTGSISVIATYSEPQQSPLSYSLGTPRSNGNFTGLTAGTYTVTISDAQSCTLTRSFTLTAPPQLTASVSVTNATCGASNGSATANVSGGVTNYTYSWSNGTNTNTISSVIAGTYTVTITDANGCSITRNANISNVGAPSISINNVINVSCYGGSNGSASVSATGGVTPYTYSWSAGSNNTSQTGLSAGSVTVSVTDNNNCLSTTSITITQPNQLIATTNIINHVSCYGGNDASASVSVTGGITPYTYTWSAGTNNNTQTTLGVGNVNVTVQDNNGCITTAMATITQPNILLATTSIVNNINCYGGNDGSASVTVTGGTTNYTYLWSNSSTESLITGLTATTYSVTVTDSKLCTTTTHIRLSYPDSLNILVGVTSSPCINSKCEGSATAIVSGGTTPYTYLWNNVTGATTSELSELCAEESYILTITDANSCTKTTSITIGSCLEIPNAFTPNADGKNDRWIIRGMEYFSDVSIKIYNRWGQPIFDFNGNYNNYENCWDGTYKNNKLPIGTYIYIIDFKNSALKPMQGTVTIIR